MHNFTLLKMFLFRRRIIFAIDIIIIAFFNRIGLNLRIIIIIIIFNFFEGSFIDCEIQ